MNYNNIDEIINKLQDIDYYEQYGDIRFLEITWEQAQLLLCYIQKLKQDIQDAKDQSIVYIFPDFS